MIGMIMRFWLSLMLEKSMIIPTIIDPWNAMENSWDYLSWSFIIHHSTIRWSMIIWDCCWIIVGIKWCGHKRAQVWMGASDSEPRCRTSSNSSCHNINIGIWHILKIAHDVYILVYLCLSIYLSIHPSIHPPIHPSTHLPTYLPASEIIR